MVEKCDINKDRVELVGHTKTRFEHLSLYGKVDIALDTFPYNGTTTTCEALWMGVPVITLIGKKHASRVGYSLLTAAGYADWVAKNRKEYLQIAKRLASNPDILAECRINQRGMIRQSILCDANGFVKDMESIYIDLLK